MINSALLNSLKNNLGIDISSILLPGKNIDMKYWAVIACDQYTSEPEYWDSIDKLIGKNPSTLRLIFPEAYLEIENEQEKSTRIKNINQTMINYVNNGYFDELNNTLILTKRTLRHGKKRYGLVLSVDLEQYNYEKGSQSLIRATEGTIIDRLPPRIRIRQNALLELPHIMLLIDDKDKTVIEPLADKAETLEPAYSFDLMKDSGSITGYKVTDEKDIENIHNALLKLADPKGFKERYGVDDKYGVLLYAVGDGNHSLATAKACWENLKKTLTPKELENHPARYALVEVVNLHDEGLDFEPINRILFNADPEHFKDSFCKYYRDKGLNAYVVNDYIQPKTENHAIKFVTNTETGYLVVESPISNLDVGTLQNFLDDYLKNNQQVSIDYVHGDDVTEKLGSQPGNMGFMLSPMDKNELFRTVILDGALPRKTFSMGHACDKRFYLEARKIK
jgi:hypothetical protein